MEFNSAQEIEWMDMMKLVLEHRLARKKLADNLREGVFRP